mmetsp:Transcript_4539/g.8620  ORF Transcript_4539/g.8620 Transcript_4539/m.8620 type:complete len:374 (-) Transcript_4539:148-1269(-)
MTLTVSNFAYRQQQQRPSRGRCLTVSTTASSTSGGDDDDDDDDDEDAETSPNEEPMISANTTSTGRNDDKESQTKNNYPGTADTTEYVSDAEEQVARANVDKALSLAFSSSDATASNDMRDTETTKRVTISESLEISFMSSSAVVSMGNADDDDDEHEHDGCDDGVPADSSLLLNPGCLSRDDECSIVLVPSAGEIATAINPTTENSVEIDHVVKSHRPCANSCSVCLSSFEIDQSIAWSGNATCPHVFHATCIQDWFVTAGRKHAKRLRRRLTAASKAMVTDPIQTILLTEPVDCPCCRRQFLPATDDNVLDYARSLYEQIMERKDGRNNNDDQNQNDNGDRVASIPIMGVSVAVAAVLARIDHHEDDSSPV